MDDQPYPRWDETELVSLNCPDCGDPVTVPVFLDWDDQIRVAEEHAGRYVQAHVSRYPAGSHPSVWITPHGDTVQRR